MLPDRATRIAEQKLMAQQLAGAGPVSDLPWRIHRNTIWQAWLDGMADAYPICRRIIGDDAFFHAARSYLIKTPPESAVLKWIGTGFADHLAGMAELSALAYLPDLTRLERAWLEAFHAPDTPVLTPQEIADMPVERLLECAITLHPSVRLIASPYPIGTIYEVHETNAIDQPDFSVTLTEGDTYLIVTRPGLDVKIHSVSGDCFKLGQWLEAGQSIGEALAQSSSIQTALGDLQFLMGCQLASSLRERPQEQ
jgi:hypothetical protein